MSDLAKALIHYAENFRFGCTEDWDREFCRHAAREYAAYLIGYGV